MKTKKKYKSRCKFCSITKCPICNSEAFEYTSYSDASWGIVEQHGLCLRCGYVVEQAYSPVYEAFWDVKRGFKLPNGEYVPSNVRKHNRIRRKKNVKGIPINPPFIRYI